MPDKAPTPILVGLGLIEEGQEVALWIAEKGRNVSKHRGLQLPQDMFERHHLNDFCVPLHRGALRDQSMREVPLLTIHIAQRDATTTRFWQEVPIRTVRVRHGHHDAASLIGIEMIKQEHRREGHCRDVEVTADRPVPRRVVQDRLVTRHAAALPAIRPMLARPRARRAVCGQRLSHRPRPRPCRRAGAAAAGCGHSPRLTEFR